VPPALPHCPEEGGGYGSPASASVGFRLGSRLGSRSCSIVIVLADVGSCWRCCWCPRCCWSGSCHRAGSRGGIIVALACRGLREIAGWVGTCGQRRKEASKSGGVGPVDGRSRKQIALVFALPKTSPICALLPCEEAGATQTTPLAFRLACRIASATCWITILNLHKSRARYRALKTATILVGPSVT
jgi:hypothetical protein